MKFEGFLSEKPDKEDMKINYVFFMIFFFRICKKNLIIEISNYPVFNFFLFLIIAEPITLFNIFNKMGTGIQED